MKKVSNINVPAAWAAQGAYGSHLPLLYAMAKTATNCIVELGSGNTSTKLLRNLCIDKRLVFFSFDNNREWCEQTGATYIHNWDESDEWVMNCSLCFVDEAPGEHRKVSIEIFRDKADIIVVHDTEEGANYVYGLRDILNTFKYRVDLDMEGFPRTTAVSNIVDIEQLNF